MVAFKYEFVLFERRGQEEPVVEDAEDDVVDAVAYSG